MCISISTCWTPANSFAVGGGLSLEDMEFALARIRSVFSISGVALTAYDPAADTNGAAREAAIHLIDVAARLAGRS